MEIQKNLFKLVNTLSHLEARNSRIIKRVFVNNLKTQGIERESLKSIEYTNKLLAFKRNRMLNENAKQYWFFKWRHLVNYQKQREKVKEINFAQIEKIFSLIEKSKTKNTFEIKRIFIFKLKTRSNYLKRLKSNILPLLIKRQDYVCTKLQRIFFDLWLTKAKIRFRIEEKRIKLSDCLKMLNLKKLRQTFKKYTRKAKINSGSSKIDYMLLQDKTKLSLQLAKNIAKQATAAKINKIIAFRDAVIKRKLEERRKKALKRVLGAFYRLLPERKALRQSFDELEEVYREYEVISESLCKKCVGKFEDEIVSVRLTTESVQDSVWLKSLLIHGRAGNADICS